VRNVVVPAILMFCLGGSVVARTPPAPKPAYNVPSASYHPRVSPDIAALQAQEQSALARGDGAAARELEQQVQAILIEQQHVVPQSAPVHIVRQPCTGESFTADQLIYSGPITALSADWELDGTMWAAFAGAADSTISVYKSTDHGAGWSLVLNYCLPPKHPISKIEMVVGQGDSGFVYVFENLPSDDGDLDVVRCDKDGGHVSSHAVRVGPDTITDFTACRDFSGDNYWLYAVSYNGKESTDWPAGYMMRSTNFGVTWAETDMSPNKARPRMAFGDSSVGYTVTVPESHHWQGLLQTGVSTNWSSPGSWRFYDYQPDTFAIDDACIAPAFTSPAASATVWIAYTHDNGTGDWDVLSAYATDTLLNWVGPDTVANTSHDERSVDLKNFTDNGNPYVNLSYCDIGPTLLGNAWLGYSSSGAPSTWTPLSDPWVNESVSVGWDYSLFPRIVYSPGGPGSGGGLVFADMGGSGYFNAPWFVAVAENRAQPRRPAAALRVLPSVANGPVRVSWSGSATRLTVTDVTGRIVRSIASPAGNSFVWDGRVPAGTYLVCLTTSSGLATRPVVIQ
jgi:hypothetical protein